MPGHVTSEEKTCSSTAGMPLDTGKCCCRLQTGWVTVITFLGPMQSMNCNANVLVIKSYHFDLLQDSATAKNNVCSAMYSNRVNI